MSRCAIHFSHVLYDPSFTQWCLHIPYVKKSTKSMIKFANFPIIWVSKVQTEIALLTTEAEYISLIQSMKYLISLRHSMLELSKVFGMKCDSWSSYTITFEDNKGSIELAKEPKYRPWTKHISLKWHHLESISNKTHQI